MKRNSAFVILGILAGLNILAWIAVLELGGERELEATFFDVSQGDAIFIETPQRHQILIDGGPSSSVILEKLGREMPFWDRTLDLIILTHPDRDHLTGLIEVLKSYKVENILWTGVLKDTAELKEWLKLIQAENAEIYIASSGQQIYGGNVSLKILYPFESLEGKKMKNTNNTSIVARLIFDKISFLFTGDIYKSVERELIKRKIEIDSDILKVSHQGSRTSTSKEFVEAVSPEIAVISVGRGNPYGHPHSETLENLQDTKILRTDLDGDIKIISNGKQYQVR